MRVWTAAVFAALSITVAPSLAWAMPKPVVPPSVVVAPLPTDSKARPFKFVRAVVAMKDGQVWGQTGALACDLNKDEHRWEASRTELDTERFSALFNEVVAQSGFKPSNDGSLFEQETPSDGLQVGARVLDMRFYVCETIGYRATVSMTVEWQIFDPLRREVIGRVKTTAGYDQRVKGFDDVSTPLLQAFRENTRALLADGAFRAAVITASVDPALQDQERGPILIAGPKPDASRPIGEVSPSVVALFAGNSMGSGFLVSDDGYILTNHHVVGGATKVRVRWSDGLEATGEVVRSDKRRDVALVKVEPRGRPPLALVRGNPTVGSPVYAVGTPLDESMLNTVTRGIVSANRFIDGFAFIQSDVGVNSGNSGGPLLDEKGRVIGITVIKLFADEGQRNLNLFIPIGDALDFLALKTGG
jgi:serine protease Do